MHAQMLYLDLAKTNAEGFWENLKEGGRRSGKDWEEVGKIGKVWERFGISGNDWEEVGNDWEEERNGKNGNL